MLKKLKGIFIEEVEGPSTPHPKGKPAPQKESKPVQSSIEVDTSVKTTGGQPDEKFVDMLLKAIESKNLDGFDYLEFKQTLKSLTNLESDESKRYQSAFAMATTMGLSKEKLFSSAQHYANVLAKEENKFVTAFKKQRDTQVLQRETAGKELQKSIAAKQAKIEKLQKEIEAEKQKLSSLESDISKSMAKVEATKERFYGSYHLVLDQIKGDIEKFNQYLP
ncbi:MAG: hypothetical protein AAFR14_11055 [Bacteroidota bacterium]